MKVFEPYQLPSITIGENVHSLIHKALHVLERAGMKLAPAGQGLVRAKSFYLQPYQEFGFGYFLARDYVASEGERGRHLTVGDFLRETAMFDYEPLPSPLPFLYAQKCVRRIIELPDLDEVPKIWNFFVKFPERHGPDNVTLVSVEWQPFENYLRLQVDVQIGCINRPLRDMPFAHSVLAIGRRLR